MLRPGTFGAFWDWQAWVQRATQLAEAARQKAGVRSWVAEQRLRKWRWAGHAARREDGRWSTQLLDWRPEGSRKKQGRPKARWEDELDEFVRKQRGGKKGEWRLLAACREEWEREEAAFSQACKAEEEQEERRGRERERGERRPRSSS